MQKTAAKNELQIINIFKGLAIILVIITHCGFHRTFKSNILIVFIINMAVPLFILISGFNYSLSAIVNNNCYSFLTTLTTIYRRIKRLTVPFLPVLLLEWFLNIYNIQAHSFLTAFISGGVGPGSYYYPLMIQFIILFPLIFYLIRHCSEKALVFIFLLQFLYEYLCYKFMINPQLYRVLCFRYLFLFSLGSYIINRKEKIKNEVLMFMFVIGINYITIVLLSPSKRIFVPFIQWSKLSLLTSFYIFPLFVWVYYNYRKEINNFLTDFLCKIAHGSWHIFLIQMIYFTTIAKYIKYSLIVSIPLNLFITLTIGYIYYKFEQIIINPKKHGLIRQELTGPKKNNKSQN